MKKLITDEYTEAVTAAVGLCGDLGAVGEVAAVRLLARLRVHDVRAPDRACAGGQRCTWTYEWQAGERDHWQSTKWSVSLTLHCQQQAEPKIIIYADRPSANCYSTDDRTKIEGLGEVVTSEIAAHLIADMDKCAEGGAA